MIPLIRAIYNTATESVYTRGRYLGEEEWQEYKSCELRLERERQQLMDALPEESRKVFERYVENRDLSATLECEMQFCRGLAAGLQLGALGTWTD